MNFTFKRAHRSRARLRLGLAAVSGGGKTMSALRLARGIVEQLIDLGVVEGTVDGKIAVIDTERRSASLYANVVPFDVLELEPPYSVDRYQQALDAAERAGYVVCILDQITHAWAGPGGQLEWMDTLKQSAKNAISPWSKVTPVQQGFYDRMLRSPMHIIATMRSKSEWVIEDVVDGNGRSKKVPRKIGLSPVQREGIEYEFTTMLDIDLESHMATASKDRTQLFADRSVRLDEAVGRELASWLMTGGEAEPDHEGRPERDVFNEKVTSWVESFPKCEDIASLAELFTKAQHEVKASIDVVGKSLVRSALDRLVAAKDLAKARLDGGPTNDLLSKTGDEEAEAAPAGTTESAPQAAVTLVGDAEIKELEHTAEACGLTPDEALGSLKLEGFYQLPLSDYAGAIELLKLAGKQKKNRNRKPARAAAGAGA